MASLPTSNENYYERIQRRWPAILFAGILGGLIGLLAGLAHLPRYEATAAVRIAIDYSRTHPLDESSERQALNRVLDLIISDATLDRAVELARQSAKESISSPEDLRSAIRLRDLRGRWELIVTADNPETASVMANAWAASTIENAESSLKHAWRASDLQKQIFDLGCQLKEASTELAGALWECSAASDGDGADELLDSLLHEAELSQGLIPALSVSSLESAVPSSNPVSKSNAAYALAGIATGLIVGTLVAGLRGPPSRPKPESSER